MNKLFLILTLCVPAFATAESVPANEILSLVPACEIVSGDFEQNKELLDLELELKSSGTFVFSKQQGALWQTLVPTKSTIFIGDDALIFFDKNDRATQKITINSSAIAQEITQIIKDAMLGNIAALEKIFTLNAEKNGENWQVKLTPKQSALPFSEITICGNVQAIASVHFINDTRDEATKIKLKNVQNNVPAALEKFKKFEQ